MDTGQRLAAYLSGDLDADERTALEAELAGDPTMRAQLERIRATDRVLAGLPEAELPAGLSDRLDAALAPELDRILGDELAARRARRAMPQWLPAAGAAAALVLVVGTGIVLVGGLGDGGEDMTTFGAPEAADLAEGDAGMADDGSMAGPVVNASGSHGGSRRPGLPGGRSRDHRARGTVAV
jgi:anti-sigma factor RsiW